MAQDLPAYTAQQVAEHNSPDDLWIIISGKVYDVSEYTDDHPGGKDILLEVSGRDATEDFDFVGHSEDAKSTLADFEIGLLAGYAERQSVTGRKHVSSTKQRAQASGHRSWGAPVLPKGPMLAAAAFPASVGAFTWILRGGLDDYASKLAPLAVVSGFWSGFSAALLVVTCAGGMVLQFARRELFKHRVVAHHPPYFEYEKII
ncbi:cytochrome b5 [Xylaria palmicola]|nr:cytochrome b5 [Xylaria palmicola]